MTTLYDSITKTIFSQASKSFQITSMGDWVAVSTPFFDRHRDLLQFYVRNTDSGLLISDEGYALSEFEATHGSLNLETIGSAISHTAAKISNGVMQVVTDEDSLFASLMELSLATIAVVGVLPKDVPHVGSRIKSQIKSVLTANAVPFSLNVKLKGGHYDHFFDFEFRVPRKLPYYVRAVGKPNDRDTFDAFLFAATDCDRTEQEVAMVTDADIRDTNRKELERLAVPVFTSAAFNQLVS